MIIKKLKSYNYRQYNYKLVLLLMIITIFGIVVIDSAGSSAGFEKKQLVGFIISLVMMLIISLFDYKFILKFYWLIYLFNIGLLLLVEFAGKNVNGATRWYEFNMEREKQMLGKQIFAGLCRDSGTQRWILANRVCKVIFNTIFCKILIKI